MSAQVAQRIGSGSTKVLVLHGWFGPSVYDGFFDDFDHARYEVAIVHNPGYGDARDAAPAADMTDLAHQLLATADGLGWDTFHVIGHSYGGAAGLRMASLAPDRVASLVGLAPVMPTGFDAIAAANCGADEHTGPAFMAAYGKGPDAPDGPRMIAGALDSVLAADEAALASLMENLYEAIDEATYKQYFLVWTGCAFSDAVAGLGTRTVFLLGEADPFAAVNYVTPTQQAMAPGAVTVRVLPGGHFLSVSGRAESAGAIQAFLADA